MFNWSNWLTWHKIPLLASDQCFVWQLAIHCVDNYFEAREFNFVNVKGNTTTNKVRTVVCCTNVKGFIEYINDKRQVSDAHLKIGLDGGGGSLKLCLSIQSNGDDPLSHSTRHKYTDGVAEKRFRDSGVKKLFILAISESTQENYQNVAQLWSSLDMNQLDATIAVDLKLANIMCGIMSHSSAFPCTWCFGKKDNLAELGELRTIGNISENYTDWRNNGEVKSKAKKYMNCIQIPVFSKDPKTEILDIVTSPELHLMLGVVNTVYNHMRAEFENEIAAWTEHCNVEREVKRGSSGFNGNACKKLLNKLDYLRATCPHGCLKYVHVLDDFNLVVKSYLDVGINVTPKVYAVFYHVKDFCSKKQRSLGFFSEQSMEAVHFDFKAVWRKYQLKTSHPDYPKHLLKAVAEYNGLHV